MLSNAFLPNDSQKISELTAEKYQPGNTYHGPYPKEYRN
jgi:hypothetical protein